MVRSVLAVAFSVVIGLAPGLPARAAEKGTDGGGAQSAASAEREAPDTGIMSCDVCAGLTCAKVIVRGRCTVDKAVEALRQERGGGPPEQQRHRARAVTQSDFEPLALDGPPAVGRTEVEPKHGKQSAGAGARLLDVYENSNQPVSVRESDSLSVKAQSFRPLDLSDEAPGDEDGGEEEAEEADAP